LTIATYSRFGDFSMHTKFGVILQT